ncbi:MAG: type III secretion system inner rod subunit SctI [Pseudodesulfovibrio sp.]|nr:type III secretion system inner rod subunit SctI [Pseudodesulfovibrio sp.]
MSSAPKNSNDHSKESVSDTTDIELSNEELESISAAGISPPNELLSKNGDGAMSNQDVMRLQYEMAQLNLQTEMTTKVTDKSSQSVQTLFKNQ